MYRPLLAGKINMTELKTCITINDLFEINALLDMQEDIKHQIQKDHESSLRNKSR
jgi:hypothetical protein